MAKQFNIPLTHRRAKRRFIVDVSGSTSQKTVMTHQPTFIPPVKEKKGLLSKLFGN